MTVSELGVGPDPDPTPTATPWQEYLAAAQSLDAVVRECAATGAADPAVAELDRLRERLDQQRNRLVGEAVRAGLPAPMLAPTDAEQAAAQARLAAVPGPAPALTECHRLLDLADAHLTSPPVSPPVPLAVAAAPARGWWPPPVWLLVAVPLGGATLLVCAFTLLLAILR